MLLALVSVAPSPNTGEAKTAGVPLSIGRSHAVVIPALVNGQGPFPFIVDTGAELSSVSAPLARQLGLVPDKAVPLTSISGTRTFPVARVGKISIGDITAERTDVVIKDLTAQGIEPDIKGVIGQNVLRQFNYLIDYKGKIFRAMPLDESALPVEGTRVPFDDADSQIVIKTRLPEFGDSVTLKLDSGTPLLVLFCPPSKCRDFRRREKVRLFVGAAQTEVTTVENLSIGSATLRNQPAALVSDEKYFEGRVENGLLPTRIFSSVLVNNKGRFVILNGKPRGD